MTDSNSQKYFGIDGCKEGWISIQSYDKRVFNPEIHESIKQFWDNHNDASLILIDMPIGLKDEGSEPRLSDKFAREYLTGKRSSSIFPVPCRAVLNTSSYEEANKINRKRTHKGLSKQSWYITPKIKELDNLLRTEEKAKNIFIEAHPEVSFTSLNGENPLEYYKKTDKGLQERLTLLESYSKQDESFLEKCLNKFPKSSVVKDDILDAWILALAAALGKSRIEFLPNQYNYDSKGLPIRIALPKFH
jgi:predicted RNase H-like nuclease